jgi:CheY-like chemotaxis protein
MDDEEIVQRVAVRMLRVLNCECVVANDGVQAIEAYKKASAENRPFGAVIMDLTIPGGMGGAEAVVKLKEIDPKARVLVSSGYSDDPVMSEFGKYGFDAALAKPYKFEELSSALSFLKKAG